MNYRDVKRLLIGAPFPSSQESHERLDNVRALAVFASDPISSNAYATEAIMSVLIVMGSGALALTLPLAMGVAALVLLVVFSYIQTIMHYPDGGGAYTVAKDNLGRIPSLLAAAALLLDYVLTVSVSTSAGVRAVTSAFPQTFDYRVLIALTAIAFITWINLRGVRESGTVFAFPTYAFVGGVLLVIIMGFVRYFELFGAAPLPHMEESVAATTSAEGFVFLWLLLRAFAGGCTALTGIEAISNGVQAFRKPESKNAVITMVAMGTIAMALFVGITFLATQMRLLPEHEESILSKMTRSITDGNLLYYWVQLFTALILFLAANTGYQDFPRLSSFLARDGFLPRWMQHRGDRLVYSYGIITLAVLASIIVLVFGANEIAMLPLYALGVMLSFTLSQAGMSRLMGKVGTLKAGESMFTGVTHIHHEGGWRWKQAVNIVGSIVTGVVFLVLLATKFIDGAWVIAMAIPVLVFMFDKIHEHYETIKHSLSTEKFQISDMMDVADVVIVPIADIHRGTLRAFRYAKRIATDVRAVCISTSPEWHERIDTRWKKFPDFTNSIDKVIIDTEYRNILDPLVDYIEKVQQEAGYSNKLITVVIPQFVPQHAVADMLHNQTAQLLHNRLRRHENVVIIEVPFHLHPPSEADELEGLPSSTAEPQAPEPEAVTTK